MIKKIRNLKLKICNCNKGFTLVEVLVAISIFTISITALMSTLASGISDTTYAKNKMTATYLAQEGIEYIRNMRDDYMLFDPQASGNGWGDFITAINPCSTYDCGLNNTATIFPTDPNFIFYPCPSYSDLNNQCRLFLNNGNYYSDGTPDGGGNGVPSGFVRTIGVRPYSGDEIAVISTVDWEQGAVWHSVSFTEDLFNWSQGQVVAP